MEYLRKPDVVTFQGEEAKKILEEYIREIDENKPEELTAAQAETMKRVAMGLIAVIEGDSPTPPSESQHSFLPTIARTLRDHLPRFAREPDRTCSSSDTDRARISHHRSLPLNQPPK